MKPLVTHGLDLSLCIHCGKGKVRRPPGDRGRLHVWCDVCNRRARKRAEQIEAIQMEARRNNDPVWWEKSPVYKKTRPDA